ncbi:phytoene desaturase family protein [Spirochaetota bacterium]
MPKKDIEIIGAGLSGLSSAALLAKKGFRVTVIEKQGSPGGAAGVYTEGGFTFDMGPTWYLMPEVFEDYFAHFNRNVSDFYELVDLDPSYKIFFGKGDSLKITRDLEQNCAIFERIEPGSGERLAKYLEDAEYKYTTAMKEFLYREYNSVFDFFNRKILFEGLRLDIFKKLDSYARNFFSSEKLRKILEYNIVFIGCTPFKSPALYSLMSHVDLTQGVRYPLGGINMLVKALYENALREGVQFIFNTHVREICVSNRKVTHLKTDDGELGAHIVLSTADYHHTEMDLLDKPHQSYSKKYWGNRVLAPAVFIVYLGLNSKVPNLQHHNLYLSPQWEEHFRSIFDMPSWPDNPSYYIGCPSKSDDSVAPEGCENLFVLVPVAPGLEDSDERREEMFHKVMSHLENIVGTDIKNSIVVKKIIAHREFAGNNMFMGTALGLAHTLFQTACFRPSHKSRKVKNLYYSGHYTHPGIGMPMVIISSQIIADKIERENNGSR